MMVMIILTAKECLLSIATVSYDYPQMRSRTMKNGQNIVSSRERKASSPKGKALKKKMNLLWETSRTSPGAQRSP
jgi:hypothetical protein